MSNDRPLMTEDIDRCAWHPERGSIAWRDIRDEGGALASTVGVCVECAVDLGGANIGTVSNPEPVAVRLISGGAPCKCGPSFCASAKGVRYYGYCGGSREVAAPDCAKCGAPHQSDAGCWLCSKNGPPNPWDAEGDRDWLRALAAGVTGSEVFAEQDAAIRAGGMPTFGESLDAVIANREGK